jgi:hypothetical protein
VAAEPVRPDGRLDAVVAKASSAVRGSAHGRDRRRPARRGQPRSSGCSTSWPPATWRANNSATPSASSAPPGRRWTPAGSGRPRTPCGGRPPAAPRRRGRPTPSTRCGGPGPRSRRCGPARSG